MKIFTLIISCFFSLSIISQGVIFERGINYFYSETAQNIVRYNDCSFIGQTSIVDGYSGTKSYLYKFDSLGNYSWSVILGRNQMTVYEIEHTTVLVNNSIIVKGFGLQGCDVGPQLKFIEKFDSNGNSIWLHTYNMNNINQNISEPFTNHSDTCYYLHNDTQISTIFSIAPSGIKYDSLVIDSDVLNGISLNHSDVLGYNFNQIYRFDGLGNIIDSINIGSSIKSIDHYHSDSILTLSQNGISIVDSAFNIVYNSPFSTNETPINLKIINGEIQLLSELNSDYHITTYDFQLNLVQDKNMGISDTLLIVDFDENGLSKAENHPLYFQNSIRLRSLSRIQTTNNFTNQLDVGLIGIEVIESSIQISQTAGVYASDHKVKVHLFNNGPDTLQSVNLNSYRDYNTCGYHVYKNHFDSLSLGPQDSLWLELGWIGFNNLASHSGDINYSFCVYSSNPNGNTDLINGNDHICASGVAGHTGIEEQMSNMKIYPNPAVNSLNIESNYEWEIGTIFNYLGQFEMEVYESKIDISSLPNGLHFLKIGNTTTKFIKL